MQLFHQVLSPLSLGFIYDQTLASKFSLKVRVQTEFTQEPYLLANFMWVGVVLPEVQ
jgi:hypothetical protein